MVRKTRQSTSEKAYDLRELRDTRPEAEKAIQSQLQIARKRIFSDAVKEKRRGLIRRGELRPLAQDKVSPGKEVFFVRKGLSRGVILTWADREKLYVAIDRSKFMKRGSRLEYIEVLKVEECFTS